MPPRKKARTGVASSFRARTSRNPAYNPYYNPSKHSLASLPYHILLTILTHAATTPTAIHNWPDPSFLLSCATLCRTLHDPAIAALYQNPPTLPPSRAHRLLAHLRARPELGQKIKRLVLEIDPVLTTKVGGVAWDVCEFVRLARGLRDLQFAHGVDKPPYHEEPGMRLGWRYPDALWDALEGKGAEEGQEKGEGVRLKAWKWNGRFLGKLSFDDIGRIHSHRSFSALTSLSLIYMDTLDADDGTGDGSVEAHIAALATSLPDLRDVKFECCSIVNRKLLTHLSTSALKLRELRLINCPLLPASDSATGIGLTTFLQQPLCRHLEVLEVLSCRACPLTFTAALSSTPALEHLSFDAHLFNTTSYSRAENADPDYGSLLPPADAALICWPRTLRSLTATSLRKWSSAEAIAFLASLVEAAPEMGRMKSVEIWCMLTDIDWRERAGLRERWGEVVGAAFSGAEMVEVRFDNARPAEQLFREDDFFKEGSVLVRKRVRVGSSRAGSSRAGGTRGAKGKSVAKGKATTKGGRTRKGAGSGLGLGKVVIVQESESEGDEEYTDD